MSHLIISETTTQDLHSLINERLVTLQCDFDALRHGMGNKARSKQSVTLERINNGLDDALEMVEGLPHAPFSPPILKGAVDAQEAAQGLADAFTSIADETCTRESMKKRIKINLDALLLAMGDLDLLSEVQK